MSIHCDKCLLEIECKEDLVTAATFFEVVPYHRTCYAEELQSVRTLFVNNQPINGLSGTIIALAAFISALLCLFMDFRGARWIGLLLFVPVLYRAYSYWKYERHLS
ncbi:hypothetical protein [Bacillus sp. 165]|uniref:hypothetical protein n=1 Tax=Bacillus sp. 165 TaxID=1529117 RepID=UPI001ADBDDAE|nr:hypothetical protein [Bacillus sp. 165]MBO9128104.1 hypothetical protein [Bacillus sp. 165]